MRNNFRIVVVNIGLVLLISFTLISCNQNDKLKVEKENHNISSIKQSKDDLLNGVSQAICYSGFREGQHPDRGEGANNPSYEETLEDLKILSTNSNFKLIRLYDSGENSAMVLKVIAENNIDIKVMLGIWLKAEFSNHEKCWWLKEPIPSEKLEENKVQNTKEIERGINLAIKYSNIVVAVAVGNEALVEWNDHMVPVETVISYVEKVKSMIKQPVTVADNFKWWALNGLELSKHVNFASVHTYPLWEGQDSDSALAYSISNIKEVKDSLQNCRIVITEAGWATIASEFGERASEVKQEKYFNDLMRWASENNYTVFFFEAFDEPWKGNPDNSLGAEKHWGIFNVDRTPKEVMKKFYPNLLKK